MGGLNDCLDGLTPSEEQYALEYNRGREVSKHINKMSYGEVARRLDTIGNLLREVEPNVLGGAAIDTLRRARQLLKDFAGEAK